MFKLLFFIVFIFGAMLFGYYTIPRGIQKSYHNEVEEKERIHEYIDIEGARNVPVPENLVLPTEVVFRNLTFRVPWKSTEVSQTGDATYTKCIGDISILVTVAKESPDIVLKFYDFDPQEAVSLGDIYNSDTRRTVATLFKTVITLEPTMLPFFSQIIHDETENPVMALIHAFTNTVSGTTAQGSFTNGTVGGYQIGNPAIMTKHVLDVYGNSSESHYAIWIHGQMTQKEMDAIISSLTIKN